MSRKKKGCPQKLTRHHRKPRSRGGVSSKKNISYVPENLHTAWHTLFSNHTPETIASIINEKWIDPNFVFICLPRKKEYKPR
jgi:hypothetical protein